MNDSNNGEIESENKIEELQDETYSERPDDHDEVPLDDPGLNFNEYGSDWLSIRRKLWYLIGYEQSGRDTFNRVYHIWQTSFEIETIGFPVVPLKAFHDFDNQSTAEGKSHRSE